MRATGMPDWMVAMVALQAASIEGNGQMPPEIASGMPCSLSVSDGDDAERAFRADEQPRQVVAGGGFLRPPRGADDLAVGEHGVERQHVVLHGAVAHRIGARGARRRHAAERGVGAGIDREEQALVAQLLVELLAGDAGLDHAVEVLGMDGEHAVHVAKVDRDAAERRVDLALERGAGAERDHRHAMLGADAHELLHVLLPLRKHDGVGRLVGDPGHGVGVLLAHRLRGHQAVAERRGERRDRGSTAFGAAARPSLRNACAVAAMPVPAALESPWNVSRAPGAAKLRG